MKNEMQNLMPKEMVALARFCKAAMLILNARLFTLLGLLMCAAAFGYVLWQPDWIRAAAAAGFAVLVYWPLQRMEARREITSTGGQDGNA